MWIHNIASSHRQRQSNGIGGSSSVYAASANTHQRTQTAWLTDCGTYEMCAPKQKYGASEMARRWWKRFEKQKTGWNCNWMRFRQARFHHPSRCCFLLLFPAQFSGGSLPLCLRPPRTHRRRLGLFGEETRWQRHVEFPNKIWRAARARSPLWEYADASARARTSHCLDRCCIRSRFTVIGFGARLHAHLPYVTFTCRWKHDRICIGIDVEPRVRMLRFRHSRLAFAFHSECRLCALLRSLFFFPNIRTRPCTRLTSHSLNYILYISTLSLSNCEHIEASRANASSLLLNLHNWIRMIHTFFLLLLFCFLFTRHFLSYHHISVFLECGFRFLCYCFSSFADSRSCSQCKSCRRVNLPLKYFNRLRRRVFRKRERRGCYALTPYALIIRCRTMGEEQTHSYGFALCSNTERSSGRAEWKRAGDSLRALCGRVITTDRLIDLQRMHF